LTEKTSDSLKIIKKKWSRETIKPLEAIFLNFLLIEQRGIYFDILNKKWVKIITKKEALIIISEIIKKLEEEEKNE
jgi:hypothetical protein